MDVDRTSHSLVVKALGSRKPNLSPTGLTGTHYSLAVSRNKGVSRIFHWGAKSGDRVLGEGTATPFPPARVSDGVL